MEKVNFHTQLKDHIKVWQNVKITGDEKIISSFKLSRAGLIRKNNDETYNLKPFIKKLYLEFSEDLLPVYLEWESFEKEHNAIISKITDEDYIKSLENNDKLSKEYLATIYLINSRKYYHKNDFESAITFTDKALDLVNNYAEAFFLRGLYKYQQAPEKYNNIIKVSDIEKNAIDDFHKAMDLCNFYSIKINQLNYDGVWLYDIIFDKFCNLVDHIKAVFKDDEKLLNILEKYFCPANMKITYDFALKELEAIKLIYARYNELKEIINFELRPEFDKIYELIELFYSDEGYNFSYEYLLKRVEVEFKKLLLSDQIDDIDSAYHYNRRKNSLNLKSFYFDNSIAFSKKYLNLLNRFNLSDETYIAGGDFNYLGDDYGDDEKKIGQRVKINSLYLKKDVISKKELSQFLTLEKDTEITWLDAVRFLNLKSLEDDLKPCYSVNSNPNPKNWNSESKIDFDTIADGYRLPTLLEWAYITKDDEYSTYKYGLKNFAKKQFMWGGIFISNDDERADENNACFRYVRNISRPELTVMPNWLSYDNFNFNLKKILKDSLYFTSLNFPVDFCKYTYSFVACNNNNSITETPFSKLFKDEVTDFEIIHEEYINFDDLDVDDWNVKIYNQNLKQEKTRVNKTFAKWMILQNNNKRYSLLLINSDPLATYQALYLSNNVRPKFVILDENDYDKAFHYSLYYKEDLVPKYVSTGKPENKTDEYFLNTYAEKHTIETDILTIYDVNNNCVAKKYLIKEY